MGNFYRKLNSIMLLLTFILFSCKENNKYQIKKLEDPEIPQQGAGIYKDFFHLSPLDTAYFKPSQYNILTEKKGDYALEHDINLFKFKYILVLGQTAYINKYLHFFQKDKDILIIGYSLEDEVYHQAHVYLNIAHFLEQNNDSDKAIYVKWVNRPSDAALRNKDISMYYKQWNIGRYTDTIYTNLNYNTIKLMYPGFNGIYINQYPKKIVLNYNYDPNTNEFYNHIEFY